MIIRIGNIKAALSLSLPHSPMHSLNPVGLSGLCKLNGSIQRLLGLPQRRAVNTSSTLYIDGRTYSCLDCRLTSDCRCTLIRVKDCHAPFKRLLVCGCRANQQANGGQLSTCRVDRTSAAASAHAVRHQSTSCEV